MPTGTIEFSCFRINLKRTSTFEPDENQIASFIEFALKIGDQGSRHLSAEVRQRNGTDFQVQPLEVGNVIGYDGPWNYEEFREICGRYYCDVIGTAGVGGTINRGERNLIERVAIRLYHEKRSVYHLLLNRRRTGMPDNQSTARSNRVRAISVLRSFSELKSQFVGKRGISDE